MPAIDITTAPAPARKVAKRPPQLVRQLGYTLAMVVNGIALWGAHRLLDWGWPAFLTADFELVLPILTASLVAGIVVNLALTATDPPRLKALTDVITGSFGIAVALRALDVFPFDFRGYDTDWSWLPRVVLIVGVVGSAISVVAGLARFFAPPPSDEGPR